MRIITWNCQGGFDKKATDLFGLAPDVAVIQECSKRASTSDSHAGYAYLWVGSNNNKGLAVFCRREWAMQQIHKPEQKWIVPITVGAPTPFTLIAVWACKVGARKRDQYIGQVYQFLRADSVFFRGPVVVAGDFNSNMMWDEGEGAGGHSDVVRMLEERGLVSAYHASFNENQGAESRPTEYFFRHKDKPYHVDYIFVPKLWLPRLRSVDVGSYAQWSRLSDHCPVVADVSAS
jgi:exodeoxyribonuclease-3